LGSIRTFFRFLRGASMAQRGRKLLRAGRTDEGRAALSDALDLLGPDEPSGSNVGVWFSQRVMALCDLSVAAAQADDIEEASKRIDEGTALWARMGLPASKHPRIQEWLTWADAYTQKHRPTFTS
jgi:hypothetical protein